LRVTSPPGTIGVKIEVIGRCRAGIIFDHERRDEHYKNAR